MCKTSLFLLVVQIPVVFLFIEFAALSNINFPSGDLVMVFLSERVSLPVDCILYIKQ